VHGERTYLDGERSDPRAIRLDLAPRFTAPSEIKSSLFRKLRETRQGGPSKSILNNPAFVLAQGHRNRGRIQHCNLVEQLEKGGWSSYATKAS
jgi:hypothetical protein